MSTPTLPAGHEEFATLAVAWALAALEPEEQARFEAHSAEGCVACADHIAATLAVGLELAYGAPDEEPPRALRDRLLAAAAKTVDASDTTALWFDGLVAAASGDGRVPGARAASDDGSFEAAVREDGAGDAPADGPRRDGQNGNDDALADGPRRGGRSGSDDASGDERRPGGRTGDREAGEGAARGGDGDGAVDVPVRDGSWASDEVVVVGSGRWLDGSRRSGGRHGVGRHGVGRHGVGRRSGRRLVAGVAAAGLVAVSAVTAWQVAGRDGGPAAPAGTAVVASRVAALTTPVGNRSVATVVVAGGRADVVADELPPNGGRGTQYVLWGVPAGEGGAPRALGSFVVTSEGLHSYPVRLAAPVGGYPVLAVSEEKAGALPAAPSEVLARGALGS